MKRRAKKLIETAYHEAGHVVSNYRLDIGGEEDGGVQWATIRDGTPDDEADFPQCFSNTAPPEMTRELLRQLPELVPYIRERTEQRVICWLAGYAAEARHRKISRSASYTTVADAIRSDDPKLEGLSWGDAINALEALEVFEPDRGKRQAWVLTLWKRSWKLTERWWSDIERIAELLLEHETIGREIISTVLDEED